MYDAIEHFTGFDISKMDEKSIFETAKKWGLVDGTMERKIN